MNDNVHGLLGAYAVDALTAEERAVFEAHLPACDECRAELATLAPVTTVLAEAEAMAPPSALRAAVMEEIGRTVQLPPAPVATVTGLARPRRWPRLALAAASVAVLAGVGVGAGVLIAGDREAPSMEQEIMMVASAPDAHAFDLDLGLAHLVMSDRMDAVVAMGEDCPEPKEGMEYQLWVVMADGSKRAGPTFTPKPDGTFMTLMDDAPMDGVTGFAVTEEPRGGSSDPTGDMVAQVEL